MTKLYGFQQDCADDIYSAWRDGARNVLLVVPTGGGKTVIFSSIIAAYPGASVAIAHRQEIVSQISLALARNGIRHRIIGPKSVAHLCTSLHLIELKRNYVDPSNRVAVAGVDTLIRMDPNDAWFKSVGLTVQDEAHHLLKDNKWGRAQSMFPNARGLGVTATPCRADGAGLGRHADGLMDWMIEGPTMRELITDGYLTDYRIFAPPNDIDLSSVPITAAGDFSPIKLSVAVHKSHVVGDVVSHYKRIANGKLGVTFAVDVESATDIAKAYRAAGVPAEAVSAKTDAGLRASILMRFRNKEILQLCNCDLFGEGFDLPALEVVSMARPTESYSLFAQQFGRALRPLEGKLNAIVIDHVGNTHRHGLPDSLRTWSMDRRGRRANGSGSDIKIRTCPGCTGAYEAYLRTCPYCAHISIPQGRSSPEQVDGDLAELTPEALAKLRGAVDAPPTFPYGAGPEIIGHLRKIHREKGEAQSVLREAISRWAGRYSQRKDPQVVAELQRRFYLTYGIDVLSAQALNKKDAEALAEKLK